MAEEKRCCEVQKPEHWIKGFTICGVFFCTLNVIWYWFINDDHNVSGIILSLYSLLLVVVLILAKVVRMEKVLVIFRFIDTKAGPGFFLMFIA